MTHACPPEHPPRTAAKVPARWDAGAVPEPDGWPTGTTAGGHRFAANDLVLIADRLNDVQAAVVTAVAEASVDRRPACWSALSEATGAGDKSLRSNLGHLARKTREETSDHHATLICRHENTRVPFGVGHRYWYWMPVGLARLWLDTTGR